MKVNDNNSARKESSHRFIQIRLSLIDYAITHTLDELLTWSLEELRSLLDSPIGFYHILESGEKDILLHQYSFSTLGKIDKSGGKNAHNNTNQDDVWADCLRQKKAVINKDYSSHPQKRTTPEGQAKVVHELVVPVIRKDKAVALLGVWNKSTGYTQQDVELVSYLADIIWEVVQQKLTDDALRKTSFDLHERVKELTCLYGISRLVEEDDITIDEILQKTVDLIPSALRSPEITCARIKLVKRSYRTKEFVETDWIQAQDIKVNNEIIGVLEVCLFEHGSENGEAPFLKEEQNLLYLIAERLGHFIEHNRAKEALHKAHDDLVVRVEERTRELTTQNMQLQNEILERKKVEEELKKSSEKLKQFAYSVVHDLKNPAISTHGLAKILNKKFGAMLAEKGKQICEQIQRSSEDIAALVEKINIFISTKENPMNMENISLEKIYQVLQKEFSVQRSIRSIQWCISNNIPDIIVADRLSIIRILRNIIENSLKYGGENLSRIEIGYRMTKDLHILTITDDGQGLESKYFENIFNWFKRKAASPEIQGSGIGLAIVKEIATLHGGDVWLEPAKPTGITFCVSLSNNLVAKKEHQHDTSDYQ